MEVQDSRLSGMRGFVIVWFGQVVSLVGSAMSGFALAIWAYQESGTATALALVAFFAFAPTVIFSPIAGALVDRWNRKLVMMLSDLGAGIASILIFGLYATGNLEIWHLYIAWAFASIFQAFQWPAYSAALTMMVPKEQLGRANGMLAVAETGSGILAPILAGLLFGIIGVSGVLLFDIVSCIFAILMLLLVRIPQPPETEEGRAGRGSLRQESAYGFRYILARRSLLGLQLTFLMNNLTATAAAVLLQPMVLARTGNDAQTLGLVLAAGSVGGLIGGLLMSTWGGPRRRVHGVLLGMAASGLVGEMVLGVGQALPIWMIGAFGAAFFVPILNGSNQAIWQAKVAPDVQGRVFSARRLIAQISAPVAMLGSGPLADVVLEPAMRPGGNLAGTLGPIFGTGPGAGMGVLIACFGFLGVLVGLGAYLFPAIRNAETILPDYEFPISQSNPAI